MVMTTGPPSHMRNAGGYFQGGYRDANIINLTWPFALL